MLPLDTRRWTPDTPVPVKPVKASELDPRMSAIAGTAIELAWFAPHIAPFRLTGFPWFETDRVYRRLPLKPAEPLRPEVDNLANCAAGGQVSFESDSRRVAVRVELAGPADMDHMPPSGQCGCDLYEGRPFAKRFVGVARFPRSATQYDCQLIEFQDRALRWFTINLPLYQGVTRLEIGLEPDSQIGGPPDFAAPGRIIFYGTSIVQGGCASRPGMAFPNIISRALNREIVDLGFSGNAQGEPEVARLVAAIPAPALFILDYEANIPSYEDFRTTLPAFIDILRGSHPETPILVVSRIAFARDVYSTEARAGRDRCRDLQAGEVDARQKAGDANIYFLDGTTLIGDSSDQCTVDGVHPTDLGFVHMAAGLEPVIRQLV